MNMIKCHYIFTGTSKASEFLSLLKANDVGVSYCWPLPHDEATMTTSIDVLEQDVTRAGMLYLANFADEKTLAEYVINYNK